MRKLLYLLPVLFLMACTTEEANPIGGPNEFPDFYAINVPDWLVGTWGYEREGYNTLKPHIRFTERTVCLFDDDTTICLDEILSTAGKSGSNIPVSEGSTPTGYYFTYGEEGGFMYNNWSFRMINGNTIEWTQTDGGILTLTRIE